MIDLLQWQVSDVIGILFPFRDADIIPGEDKMPSFRVPALTVFHIQFKGMLFCPLSGIITAVSGHDVFRGTKLFHCSSGVFPVFNNVFENIEPSFDLNSVNTHNSNSCIWYLV